MIDNVRTTISISIMIGSIVWGFIGMFGSVIPLFEGNIELFLIMLISGIIGISTPKLMVDVFHDRIEQWEQRKEIINK